uniref:Uncharacterized protein n=1 Tax=Hordeum vulgare subsp. vulgare TaxID=112509 RepID=A0A8I7B510_HORVV
MPDGREWVGRGRTELSFSKFNSTRARLVRSSSKLVFFFLLASLKKKRHSSSTKKARPSLCLPMPRH